MSYEERVATALREGNEGQLLELIGEEIEAAEANIRAKESAITGLAQLYVDRSLPERIQAIAVNYAHRLSVFSKPRLAKITKGLVDYIAKVPHSERLQIELSKWLIDWCIAEKRTYLKHRMELRLSSLLLEVGEPDRATKIIEPILVEVRKADDKLLLVELYLLESKINYKVKNYAKAKASLTASRANSNNVYCQPGIIAEIDLMSGILYAQDQDYKTSYSFFYEALEPLM
jgi:26S proteasome regulatory subunit N6